MAHPEALSPTIAEQSQKDPRQGFERIRDSAIPGFGSIARMESASVCPLTSRFGTVSDKGAVNSG